MGSSNYGLNIQNIPRDSDDGAAVKDTLVADDGFLIWDWDFKNAEGFGVAYKSGDVNLLEAVNGTKDYHSYNAARFFGVPYEQIFRDACDEYIEETTGIFHAAVEACVLNKKLRDLSKRTNHGANYNMGAMVMLQTMGSKKVRDAARLLGLPAHIDLIDVCKYLLSVYERTYPRVKTTYYEKIKHDIKTTGLLVGDTGWTRRCFGNPSNNKPDLNSYVAHVTQSLNAALLDIALVRVFNELAFNTHFKLIAQIHDNLLAQIRIGHEYLAKRVKELMTISVPITDCLGKVRIMTVPTDMKCHGLSWKGS